MNKLTKTRLGLLGRVEQAEHRVGQQPEQQLEPKPIRDQAVDRHNPPRPSMDWER